MHVRFQYLKLALLLLGMGTVACSKTDPAPGAKDGPVIRVKSAPVQIRDVVDTLSIFGTVSLRQEAFLASQFDGRLTDFSLLLGDRVKKGQRIGTIVPPAREALLQIANKVPAQQRLILQRQIKEIALLSPIDGVVLEVRRHTGDVLQKGDPVVHLGDLRILDVRGDLPVKFLPVVKRLKQVEVTFVNYPHQPIRLPIEAISGNIDTAKQTAVLRLRLDNPEGEFRPGMLARLAIPAAEHPQALTIPRSALLEEEGIHYVFILKGNVVEKHLVKVGILQDDFVEILQGVQAGDQVVTEKAYSLEDGMEVRVE